jgi:hypothetical protein
VLHTLPSKGWQFRALLTFFLNTGPTSRIVGPFSFTAVSYRRTASSLLPYSLHPLVAAKQHFSSAFTGDEPIKLDEPWLAALALGFSVIVGITGAARKQGLALDWLWFDHVDKARPPAHLGRSGSRNSCLGRLLLHHDTATQILPGLGPSA